MSFGRNRTFKSVSLFERITGASLMYLLVLQNLCFALPTTVASAPLPLLLVSADIVISQVYGGAGCGTAGCSTYKNDYIEIFNRGSSAVNLTGWSVQYASSTGNFNAATALSGTLLPGQYLLIQEGFGANGINSLPTPDISGIIAMSASAGKVVVANTATALACGATGTPCSTAQLAQIIDLVGYGTGTTYFEGTGSAPTLGTSNAIFRAGGGCTDTDNNPTDFSAAASNPRNSSSTFGSCGLPTPTPTASPTPTNTPTPTPTPTATPTPTPTPTPVPPADHLTISQVYGGGGNSSATFRNDYVEIYNPTSSEVDTAGWTLQYASATGTSWTNNQPLGGIIGPGEYYLVSLASGGAVGQELPEANILGSINMSGTTGKIALVSNGDPLAGGCPTGDTDLVDFVGYGTANCFEGPQRAPAPSNTTAIFRNAAGAQDTNNNGFDFAAAAPAPRRTTPIQEIGPAVITTQPTRDGSNAPLDASPTIVFSEAVTVDPNWFSISCTSGLHNDVTMASANGGKTWELTPNQNFTPGEQCTVTITKEAIHDVDTDDSAPNTDTLPANYVWSFTVATMAQPAPYAPEVHLAMGNPSNAAPDILEPDNYLMQKPGIALSYNRDKGTPNWVSWHLSNDWYGTLGRTDTFRPDPQVPAEWYRVTDFDYSFSGFDRGHMTPNADRDHQSMVPINQETFLMTNMVPQAPDNNQGPWADMENDLRLQTDSGNELFIVSGPHGIGGQGDNGPANTIANGRVTVPAYTWKVVLVLPNGVVDPNQVTANARTFAVLMPNVNGIFDHNWRQYKVSVRQVEMVTGYNFFSNVSAAVQNSIENGICESAACNGMGDSPNPPGTADQTVAGIEDTQVQFTLNAVNPSGGSLISTINAPSNGSVNCVAINCTYTPGLNFNGTDTFTYSVSNGAASSNTSTVTVNVAPVNDLPTVTNSQPSNYPSVQYSDAIQPIAVAAFDVESPAGLLVPSYSFSEDGGAPASGLPAGLSLNQTSTPGVWSLTGNIAEAAGTYVISITFADADGGSASTSVTINVTREDASLVISGPTSIAVDPATGRSPAFTLTADISQAADGAPGNIENAVPVVFHLTSVGSATTAYTCTAATLEPGTSIASCTFTGVNVDVYDVTAIIGGGFYQGTGRSVVAVFNPSLGFVTGSGALNRSVNGESFTVEFGVSLQHDRDGRPKGSFSYVEHRTSGDLLFRATSIKALALVGGEARVAGTGTINGLGSYTFVARMADNGEPGRNDTIGLRIMDAEGTVNAGLTFGPVTLASGNIKIH
jgi:endonuclease G, mitochondrial